MFFWVCQVFGEHRVLRLTAKVRAVEMGRNRSRGPRLSKSDLPTRVHGLCGHGLCANSEVARESHSRLG